MEYKYRLLFVGGNHFDMSSTMAPKELREFILEAKSILDESTGNIWFTKHLILIQNLTGNYVETVPNPE